MKKQTLFNIMCTAVLGMAVVSCAKWEEPEFQVPHYEGPEATRTVADIKALHATGTGTQDPISPDSADFIVKAVVVSSDKGGNCYKYMTLQDETGGIELAVDRTGLYNEYPVGQTVYLNCKSLIVSDYHGKYQVGWRNEGTVGRINQLLLGQYLQKDGLPDLNHPLVANPIQINSANDLIDEYVNCLVKIDNCRFAAECDNQPLATNDLTMDRRLHVNDATITVRTSNYANFRSTVIHAGQNYCLYGILSKYNNDYQLTLRTKDDIQSGYALIRSVTFDENSLGAGGWTSTGGWEFKNYQGDAFMFHNGSAETCDDWLISPELSFDDAGDLTLLIDHKNNVEGSPASYYEVYYSTTYSGGTEGPDAAQWTPCSPNLNDFQANYALSNPLDLSAAGNVPFRIALRYHKQGNADGTRWFVRGLHFYRH